MIFLVIFIAGFRGDLSRSRPIEIFPDMDRQPKVRPQAPNLFDTIYGGGEVKSDGRGSRLPFKGTIARGVSFESVPINTGRKIDSNDFPRCHYLSISVLMSFSDKII